MQVTKRDGTKEKFDIAKVKQSIAFACQGVDVNPLELESRIDYFLKDGITTSAIQENIIEHAKQLASASAPEWLLVAGNAYVGANGDWPARYIPAHVRRYGDGTCLTHSAGRTR